MGCLHLVAPSKNADKSLEVTSIYMLASKCSCRGDSFARKREQVECHVYNGIPTMRSNRENMKTVKAEDREDLFHRTREREAEKVGNNRGLRARNQNW